ncbi:MAG: bifunctional 4-hydroxy-2-oxoglutarate aldolase/2-dehydro-3-deoxy-phosphogluconate aldolase [Alphaproteobacteria bacterium]
MKFASFLDIFAVSPICAVVTLPDEALAAPVAQALARAGVKTLEITLRTAAGIPAIAKIAREVPEILVGAGTVLKPDDMHKAIDAGAKFNISPGATPDLLAAGRAASVPYLPGIGTASELMAALGHGYDCFKIFPIMPMGGVQFARVLGGPFPKLKFCANGGVTLESSAELLKEPNIVGVGAGWLTPPDALKDRDFARVEALARTAVAKLRKA